MAPRATPLKGEYEKNIHAAPATPRSCRTSVGSSRSEDPPRCTTSPWSSTTMRCARRFTTLKFCSTSSTVECAAARSSTPGELTNDFRGESLGGLVDEQQRPIVQERPRDREHLLLAAREGAGSLATALLSTRERARRPRRS
jgi:hypothetical protein